MLKIKNPFRQNNQKKVAKKLRFIFERNFTLFKVLLSKLTQLDIVPKIIGDSKKAGNRLEKQL